MAYINTYKPPPSTLSEEEALATLKEPYDLNSIIPVPSILQTSRVSLVPFIPSIHAHEFFEEYFKTPSLDAQFPLSLGPTFTDGLRFVETVCRRLPESTLFAIIDKTRAEPQKRVAGIIGWGHASPQMRSLEIGPIVILPSFQGTFVSSHAIGLLLKYALDPPNEGGLGFRRVVWSTSPLNVKSMGVAEKMGFRREGVMRWAWVLPEGKAGQRPVGEDVGRGKGDGRDNVSLAICWDDWVGGGKERVQERMNRL